MAAVTAKAAMKIRPNIKLPLNFRPAARLCRTLMSICAQFERFLTLTRDPPLLPATAQFAHQVSPRTH